MNLYLLSVILCCTMLSSETESAVANARFFNPAFPGKCTLDLEHIMSPGQKGKAPDHPCAGVTCMENSYVEFKTCVPMAPPMGCKIRDFVDINREFPQCCERKYECTKFV